MDNFKKVFYAGTVFTLSLALLTLNSCKKRGCTNEEALNYSAEATKDDGSCVTLLEGCTDPNSVNYNSEAKISDGTCEYLTNTVILNFDHRIDNENLVLNEFNYKNAAGNIYSIERIKYIISNITFHNVDGTTFEDSSFHYRDVLNETTRSYSINNVPDGHYTAVSFTFGLDSLENTTGSLPNEQVYNSMEWPIMMGGGYHYMKFEGKFVDSLGGHSNYNLHTGITKTTGENIHHHLNIELENTIFTVENNIWDLQIVMNMNKWFVDPNMYDIEKFGSAIMGDSLAQEMIEENGESVFTSGYLFEK